MFIYYDNIAIELTPTAKVSLINYAVAVIEEMQVDDTEYPECWTSCVITFDGIQPVFQWGSIEDMSDLDEGIYVECPYEIS